MAATSLNQVHYLPQENGMKTPVRALVPLTEWGRYTLAATIPFYYEVSVMTIIPRAWRVTFQGTNDVFERDLPGTFLEDLQSYLTAPTDPTKRTKVYPFSAGPITTDMSEVRKLEMLFWPIMPQGCLSKFAASTGIALLGIQEWEETAMSVLTRRDPLGQTNDKMVPFRAAPVPGPSKSSVLKVNPDRGHQSGGAQRAWGVDLTKLEAEDLLDWLEANGRSGKLTFVAGKGFAVR
jgi:hypothetical protein